jgi:hypothetical protein
MSTDSPGKPRRVDSVIINDDPEAPSILNPMTGDIYVTNPVGKHIMEVADGTKTVDEIISSVLVEFKGAPADAVGRDVQVFVRDGIEKGILSWQTP